MPTITAPPALLRLLPACDVSEFPVEANALRQTAIRKASASTSDVARVLKSAVPTDGGEWCGVMATCWVALSKMRQRGMRVRTVSQRMRRLLCRLPEMCADIKKNLPALVSGALEATGVVNLSRHAAMGDMCAAILADYGDCKPMAAFMVERMLLEVGNDLAAIAATSAAASDALCWVCAVLMAHAVNVHRDCGTTMTGAQAPVVMQLFGSHSVVVSWMTTPARPGRVSDDIIGRFFWNMPRLVNGAAIVVPQGLPHMYLPVVHAEVDPDSTLKVMLMQLSRTVGPALVFDDALAAVDGSKWPDLRELVCRMRSRLVEPPAKTPTHAVTAKQVQLWADAMNGALVHDMRVLLRRLYPDATSAVAALERAYDLASMDENMGGATAHWFPGCQNVPPRLLGTTLQALVHTLRKHVLQGAAQLMQRAIVHGDMESATGEALMAHGIALDFLLWRVEEQVSPCELELPPGGGVNLRMHNAEIVYTDNY